MLTALLPALAVLLALTLRPVVHVSMCRRQRRVLTALLPALAVLLALTSAVLGAIWSEPFLLYRLCRGQCDSFNTERGGGVTSYV